MTTHEEFIIKSFEELKAFDTKNAKKSKEILEKAYELSNLTSDKDKNAFYWALNGLAKTTNTGVIKPPGKYLYYYDKTAQQEADSDGQIDDAETLKVRQKEALLYPTMVEYFRENLGYRAMNTSNYKVLGKWGNPDITGLRVDDALLNMTAVEIVTAEVKIELNNWEYNIFEAISHLRFANRAYFVFGESFDRFRSIPNELRYYAERYGIGVIGIFFTNDAKFVDFKAGKISKIDMETDLEDVYEIFPAPFHHVPVKYQSKMFAAMGVKSTQDLFRWGE